MTRWIPQILALLCVAQPAWAEEDEAVLGPVSMDWEGTPVAPPPHAWVGAGLAWATQAQTHGGPTSGAGVDFIWVNRGQTSKRTLRFTHRTWRAPTDAVEQRLKGRGVTEGVQSYWAGRMTLSERTKLVNVGKQAPHFGLELGWHLQRTQHVGETTQKYLLREHNLYWGPQWTAHLGPELQLGYYKSEDALYITAYGRLHAPLFAELSDKGEGIVIKGKMWDPVQTVAPEAEAGLSMGGRLDPYFITLSIGGRTLGPSEVDTSRGQTSWQTMGTVDLAVSKAF